MNDTYNCIPTNVWKSEIRTPSRHYSTLPLRKPNLSIKPRGFIGRRKPREEEDRSNQSYTTLCTEIHESFIHTVRINKGNFFSICREKTWKNTDSSLTCKHYFENSAQYLPAEILENRNVPIFGGFESQKSGLAR